MTEFKFETNNITNTMDAYLRRAGLNRYRVLVAVDENDTKMYVVAKDQTAIYEHTSAEAIGAYLDMLVVDKKFKMNGK